jgi:hypothetical protein
VKSRGKPAFSDEEDESEGKVEKEPQLPSHLRSAASVAACHRPDSSWAQDLTGSVTTANMLHWGSAQDRHKNSAARRLISPPAGVSPPPDDHGAEHDMTNPPSSNPSVKRSNIPSLPSSSKKARQGGQTASEEDALDDIDEDLK